MKMRKVAAGGFCEYTGELVFTRTFEECEAADFHHSGIIPPDYLERVESNDIIYFYVWHGKEVHAWMMRWENGLHKEERYKDVEEQIGKKLGFDSLLRG